MESMIMGDHEYPPTDSIEEVVPKPVGRSYECILCKRGFTTAQALGGHMNIHRKDRAKSRSNNYLSNNNNSSSQVEDHNYYAGPRFYQPIFTNYPQTCISNHQEGQVFYTTYYASTSSTSLPTNYDHNNHHDIEGVITSPSREEKMMSLSLQFGWSVGEDKDSKGGIQDENKEDGMDLELRLGQ